jgi:hypothetical protein
MKMKTSIRGVTAIALVLLSTAACVPPRKPTPPGPFPQGHCLLSKADQPATMAFCETFDAPRGSPLTRSGDLNPVLWGVSRLGDTNPGQDLLNTFYPATMSACGNPAVLPPYTVKVCNGRMFDVLNDHDGVVVQAMYPKQPFDIAGRTGTVAFDVSDDSGGTHASWPEFWWTDQPVPAPTDDFPLHAPLARNAVGISLAASNSPTCPGRVTVDQMSVVRNHVLQQIPFSTPGCVVMGSASGALNHFEVRINQSRIEVWAADAGSTAVRLIAFANNANITMTRGVVWVEDVHYNASKAGGAQTTHTFAWDNVAFDGPKLYRDLTFDVRESRVPSNGGLNLGWAVNPSTRPLLQVSGVVWTQAPTAALVTFNFWGEATVVPSVSVNGRPAIATAWPFDGETFQWRTIAVPVPLSDVHAGTNYITLSDTDTAVVANVNLALIAAARVP